MENAFDRMMEMFKDTADTVIFEPTSFEGMVSGSPYDSKTDTSYLGMSMISSLDEAVSCKYSKAVSDQFPDFQKKFQEAYEKAAPNTKDTRGE